MLAGDRLCMVFSATRDLALARDLASVTGVVRRAARELTGADGVTFVIREGEYCHYVDEDAIAPLWKGRRFPMDTCISGWAMLHDRAAAIPDISVDERIPQDAYRPTFVKSLLMMPVRTTEPVAAIGAYWAHTHTASPDEIELLQSLADNAALALENIGLRTTLDAGVVGPAASHPDATDTNDAREGAETGRLKSRLIAMVAHELRQPLHAAAAALQILRRNADQAAGERPRAVLERQIRHMSRIVEDLLDAPRIVGGDIALEKSLVDIRDIVRDAVETVDAAIKDGHHELTISLPDEPEYIEADGMRLRQVFINLLSNAAKYTPRGGRIQLATSVADGGLLIRVRDSGVGIPRHELTRIFDVFTRGHGRPEKGLGIGLAIARRVVELHGGSIEATSDGPGSGSEFNVRLPRAAAGIGHSV